MAVQTENDYWNNFNKIIVPLLIAVLGFFVKTEFLEVKAELAEIRKEIAGDNITEKVGEIRLGQVEKDIEHLKKEHILFTKPDEIKLKKPY